MFLLFVILVFGIHVSQGLLDGLQEVSTSQRLDDLTAEILSLKQKVTMHESKALIFIYTISILQLKVIYDTVHKASICLLTTSLYKQSKLNKQYIISNIVSARVLIKAVYIFVNI